METVVISAFPGMGKSTTYNKSLDIAELTIWDSDSSKFDKSEFPQNYIEHIKNGIEQKVDIIFVSSHEEVRKAMIDAGIKFIVYYPSKERKNEFIQNYKNRGNSENFIKVLESKWDEWIDALDEANRNQTAEGPKYAQIPNGFLNLSVFYTIEKGELS